MRRRAALALVGLAAAILVLGAADLFLREGPPVPPAPPPGEGPPPPAPPPRPAPPETPAPPPAAVPGQPPEPGPSIRGGRRLPPEEEEEDEADFLRYPEGEKGPVVVGVVLKAGDPDPDCWIALEDAADPAREDPSEVETLPGGRFRLRGFTAGRYRVRAKGDDTPAVYSRFLEARDGEVADAGILRLRRPGCVSGVLRDGEGWETDGEVRLFGRDPASLVRRVVEQVPALGRQGFQLAPHEAGEFEIAAAGEAGWAIHRGRTDGAGLAWADIRLRPWASLAADHAPAKPGALEVRGLRCTLEVLEVPDLGAAPAVRSVAGPARFDRLLPGRYHLRSRWEERSGAAWKERTAEAGITVAEGAGATAEIPR